MGSLWSSIVSLFFSKRLEACLIGLDNAELNRSPTEAPPSTVGLDVKIMKKSGVNFKLWDLGGQKRFRNEWKQYTHGCDVIIFVIDVSDSTRFSEARHELHQLLEDRELSSIPLLILANKIDLGPVVNETQLIRELNLDYIVDNAWLITPISAKRGDNIDRALTFLTQYGH